MIFLYFAKHDNDDDEELNDVNRCLLNADALREALSDAAASASKDTTKVF